MCIFFFSLSLSFSLSFFHIRNDTCKIMVGCPSCTDPSIIVNTTCTHVWTPWSIPQKMGERWARTPVLTPVPLQAIHSSPSCRCRFQTGETPEKLAHMFRLLGPCLELVKSVSNSAHMLDSWSACLETLLTKFAHMLDSLVRVSQQQRWKE